MTTRNKEKKIGFHSPEKTAEVLTKLNKKFGEIFEDSSYSNDATDSVCSEELDLHVFIPNAEQDDIDNAEYGTFVVDKISTYGEGDYDKIFDSLHEVMQYIESLIVAPKIADGLEQQQAGVIAEVTKTIL